MLILFGSRLQHVACPGSGSPRQKPIKPMELCRLTWRTQVVFRFGDDLEMTWRWRGFFEIMVPRCSQYPWITSTEYSSDPQKVCIEYCLNGSYCESLQTPSIKGHSSRAVHGTSTAIGPLLILPSHCAWIPAPHFWAMWAIAISIASIAIFQLGKSSANSIKFQLAWSWQDGATIRWTKRCLACSLCHQLLGHQFTSIQIPGNIW